MKTLTGNTLILKEVRMENTFFEIGFVTNQTKGERFN